MTANNMVLPKIERDAVSRNYGRFIIGPLERGFGTTLGNALRRVMLSSLPGAAVTSMRVANVPHEFSAIPSVREDMTQLILNVKQLRVRLHDGVESARCRLDVQGAGVVTAADLICPAEVEIKNPDLYLFSVDDDQARIEMELNIEAGRGYSPAEERGRLPIGEVPVDAIFSPIRRVAFDVERARVGQKTNYDRVILEIWTDGTIEPETAMSEAATILMQHLGIIANVDPAMFAVGQEPEEPEEPKRPDYYDLPIETLDLSVRVFNSLKRTGITTIGEVLEILEKGEDAMLAIRNFGYKSLDELLTRLREKGYLGEAQEEGAEVVE
ncbi:MAG TPA: DNA-directed RNA polymerase subunit alpha [Aggregatilineales bacterium]|nr:DNA-directed RNA polymerase subunit alpha [Aggregatilineales bacterium]